MALYSISFRSEELDARVSVNVTIPRIYGKHNMTGSFPVLYLTHGNTDDRSAWQRNTAVERIADEYNLITVMTSTWASFGMDMYKGRKYFSYMSKELIPLMHNLLPIAEGRENHFIAGLSLGGYMAFKLGLVRNDYFSAIGAFSSPIDMLDTMRLAEEGKTPSGSDFEQCFGNVAYMKQWPNDTMAMVREMKEKNVFIPKFYQSCGTSDFTFEQNENSHALLEEIGIPDYKYVTREGNHNWEFWETSLKDYLQWILPENKPYRNMSFKDGRPQPNLSPRTDLPSRTYEPCTMPTIDIRAVFESYAARGSLDGEFILPKETPETQWKHAEVLVHPYNEDYTYFQRKYDLETIAEEKHTAICCPQLNDSEGLDQPEGRAFGKLADEEIPALLRFLFGHNREIAAESTKEVK